MKLSKVLLERAKTAKSADELLEMAKAENIELTAEEAAKYFAELNKTGELSDKELGNVVGGYDRICAERKIFLKIGCKVITNKGLLFCDSCCYVGSFIATALKYEEKFDPDALRGIYDISEAELLCPRCNIRRWKKAIDGDVILISTDY